MAVVKMTIFDCLDADLMRRLQGDAKTVATVMIGCLDRAQSADHHYMLQLSRGALLLLHDLGVQVVG